MDLEDFFTSTNIRKRNMHLPVETSRTQQCGIKHIRPVGGGNDDHPLCRVKTVHFHKKLIQGLLSLIVPASKSGSPAASDRVDFIDEENAWRIATSFLKEVPDPARTNSNKHFHKIRTAHTEKRNVRLPCNSFGEQSLSGPRRPGHQHSLWNPSSQLTEFGGILQEFYGFRQIGLGLFHSGHILEGNFHFIRIHFLGTASSKGEKPSCPHPLHPAHEEDPDSKNQKEWTPVNKQV